MTEKTQFGVHVSPGSAETFVRRGGIANHQLIAYSLKTPQRRRLMFMTVRKDDSSSDATRTCSVMGCRRA